jgi:NitT/TauT family transport system substrate-binding protein
MSSPGNGTALASRHRRSSLHPPLRRRRFSAVALVAAFALALAACGPGTGPSPSPTNPAAATTAPGDTSRPESPTPPGEPTSLVVGLGFIPSVQFAPFYLAQQAGYYRDAGLEVELQNKIDPDLITLIAQGAVDIGSADGTSVIAAVSQGIPVVYGATIYGQYPSIVFAKASSGIRTAADLEGKRIGIPGKFGTSWIMLLGLLESAGLGEDDVEFVLYPDFGQGVALQQGAVDAATGFANNEPVQLELTGEDAVVLHIDDITPLPGPGMVTGTRTLETKGDALRAFVAATLRAMEEIRSDPARGLDASIAAVPELGQDRATQEAILRATIDAWQLSTDPQAPLGAFDREAWAASAAFMTELGLVATPVTVDQLVTGELLPFAD